MNLNIQAWLPSRGNVLFTILAISALVIANRAGALSFASPEAPTLSTNTIPYQGRIANAGGIPVTGNVAMTFRLYNIAAGGTALWEEAWTGGNQVRVSDGLFNLMLGSLTPIPQSLITSNSNLWLGIKVGSDAEMSPRMQLGSVPFATQALTVPDRSITMAKLASDVNLVPPGGSITTTMLANGAVSLAKLGEQPYYFHGALATPIEWMADLIVNKRYARFCQAIGRTFSRADELQHHYNGGRSNGWIYPGYYYVGPRLFSDDTYFAGVAEPTSPYGVWKRGPGAPVATNTSENYWTLELSAIIWCS